MAHAIDKSAVREMGKVVRVERRVIEPLPKRGKVVYRGHAYYISSFRIHENGSYSYTIYPFDPELRTLNVITLPMLVKEMEAYARYEVGQKVHLAYSNVMQIYKRHWSFRDGTAWYYVADPNRNVAAGWFNQGTMMRYDRDLDPIRDTDVAPTPPQRSFPRHGR